MQRLNETMYFIVNPMAGNKGSIKTWKKVEEILKSEDVPYEVFLRKKKGMR